MLSKNALLSMIDHTLLTPAATDDDVRTLVATAHQLGVLAVCVSPNRLPAQSVRPLRLAAVCGFPSGAHEATMKAQEAARAIAAGADEIDMVVDLGLMKSQDFSAVERDIRTVRDACPASVLLKVILESAALNEQELIAGCQAAESAGADFVKTSTGFHPAGGASARAVEIMARTVGGRLGVKASGGIRDVATVQNMISAGATRLGLSKTEAILAEWVQQ